MSECVMSDLSCDKCRKRPQVTHVMLMSFEDKDIGEKDEVGQ